MEHRSAQYIIKGMQRDLSRSKHNPEYAYECHNIRITPMNGDTLLSVTNERGNREVSLVDENHRPLAIPDYLEYVGHCVVDKYLVLFLGGRNASTGYKEEAIYRIHVKSDPPPTKWIAKKLWYGYGNTSSDFLGLNPIYPIQAYGQYESPDVVKVYWIDGNHQPRMLNIMKEINQEYPYAFDFTPTLIPFEISIQANITNSSTSEFKAGVVQYYVTFFNKFGLQSNIVATSELLYLSDPTRGGAPEEDTASNVELIITTKNRQFDFIRLYSAYWPSEGTPQVKIVGDYSMDVWVSNPRQTIIDNNSTGTTVDPYELLYINREPIIAKTMAEKDNTKFFGNLSRMLPPITDEPKMEAGIVVEWGLLTEVKKARVLWGTWRMPYKDAINGGSYVYENQLKYGQRKCTVFKYLEWYMIGVQLQHITGAWGDPIYLGRFQNTKAPYFYKGEASYFEVGKPAIHLTSSAATRLEKLGYVRARAVVVYPEGNQRTVIAQGILCPTVYNVGDRYTNTPYAQSSWVSRPNLPFNISNKTDSRVLSGLQGRQSTVAATVTNGYSVIGANFTTAGSWAEFRHNEPIPMNWEENSEIQCLAGARQSPLRGADTEDIMKWVFEHNEYYYVDQSIVTMHSPEFEFGEVTGTLSNVKLRIIGTARITANSSDVEIETSTPPFSKDNSAGVQKFNIGTRNRNPQASKSLLGASYWFDRMWTKGTDTTVRPFRVYMWHANRSLNNQGTPTGDEVRTAMLKKKRMSNLKFSDLNIYLDANNIWGSRDSIQDVSVFNSTDSPLLRIKGNGNSHTINYYGIIDKVITPSFVNETYTAYSTGSSYNKQDGYPIVASGPNIGAAAQSNYDMFVNGPRDIRGMGINQTNIPYMGTEPVSMKYKSSPHAVIVLNTKENRYVTLPTHYEVNSSGVTTSVNPSASGTASGACYFWEQALQNGGTPVTGSIQEVLNYTSTIYDNYYPYFWLAELYRDDVVVDTSEQAIQNYKWVPAGQPINLRNLSMEMLYGDTYLQRYDCLRTYPYSDEDQNSVVDIVSFYCETRVNIDGRYDKNRGQTSNLYMTPNIFNKLNKVYSLKHGMFTYRILDTNKFSNTNFPSSLVISKEHSVLEDVDQSTLINISSIYTCDVNKGNISCITKLGNELYCFQEHATSNILFNSRVQIPTSDSVPIEITNGMKLSGVRYISNTIGVFNKWSVIATHNAIYTIDDYTSSIYMFNGQSYTSLSDKLGFKHWLGENRHTRGDVTETWEPSGFYNYVSFYDETNGDVYFVNRDTALVYSEQLGQFTSFMSYGGVPAIFSFNKYLVSFKERKLWLHFKGEYNMFYGTKQSYSVTIVANPDEPLDKIFNVVEYRATESTVTIDENNPEYPIIDTNDKPEGTVFNQFEIRNNYQWGTTDLNVDRTGLYSPLRRKFRIWRVQVPRANTFKGGIVKEYTIRDRIRSPWATIKLERNDPDNTAIELHDMIVHYSV